MVVTSPRLDGLRDAPDAEAVLRIALEETLAVAGAQRGFVALVDLGSGRLFAIQGVGLDGDLDRLRPLEIGGAQHPLYEVLREGEIKEVERDSLARAPYALLRQLGLRGATVVPLPLDVTVSPCLSSGRCLSRNCLVGERSPSASPDEEWQRRVSASCERATVLRSPAALVVDAVGLDRPTQRRLRDVADIAARALRRFPSAAAVPGTTRLGAAEEEWQQRAFAAVDEPVLVADGQANLLFANAPARRLFNASPSDSEGRRRAVDFNRMLLAAWLTSYLRVPESERPRELALVDPEFGSELLFELLGRTAYSSMAREAGTVVVLKDVSDLRHAAEELEASLRRAEAHAASASREREQLQLVLERIDQAIVVADPRGAGGEGVLASGAMDVLRMNDAARRLLQPQADAPERQRETVKRNDAIVTSFISQVGIGGSEAETELSLVEPSSGQARAFAAHAAIARDRVGAAVAIVCVLSDLTELRELERRRVERQLFESEKLAATGRLAASFAHEINNPLEAMNNSLYLLAAQLPPAHPSRRYVDIARGETERISRTVRQILGFYRPSAGRGPTDVNALVSEVAELLQSQLRKGRISCELRLGDGLPRIVASNDQLRQVFLNLVLNAIQALPTGGRIGISTSFAEASPGASVADGRIAVEVRDDGAGIPAEIRDQLFEPFVTTKERSGIGLGLWICREIVTAHGGSIAVESQPGRGSAFLVSLPVKPREVAA